MTMAIPFTLPSDQETEDHYRRLNQLILDLYEVIQILLIRPPRPQGARMRRGDDEGGTNRRSSPHTSSSITHNNNRSISSEVPRGAVIPSSSLRSDVQRNSTSDITNHGLPDLVLSTTSNNASIQPDSTKVLPPRRQRRKQTKTEKSNSHQHSINLAFALQHQSSSSHHQVSSRISSLNGEESSCSETKSIKVKASSLVSLLLPQTVSGQIWTTLFIIVGWKLLARQR